MVRALRARYGMASRERAAEPDGCEDAAPPQMQQAAFAWDATRE
jgi:hypothetical protein